MYHSREKSVSPIQMINEKILTPHKSFMLMAQTALATGQFPNQMGFWGAVFPSVQTRMMCSTNQAHLQYEEGTSSVQMRMCSASKVFHQ